MDTANNGSQQKIDFAARTRETDRRLDEGERYRAMRARLEPIDARIFHGLLSRRDWDEVRDFVAAVHAAGSFHAGARLCGLRGSRLQQARKIASKLRVFDREPVYDGRQRHSDRVTVDQDRVDYFRAVSKSACQQPGSSQLPIGDQQVTSRGPPGDQQVTYWLPLGHQQHPSKIGEPIARTCAGAGARTQGDPIRYDDRSIDRILRELEDSTDADWREVRQQIARVVDRPEFLASWHKRGCPARDIRYAIVAWILFRTVLEDEDRFWEIADAACSADRPWRYAQRCWRNEAVEAGLPYNAIRREISKRIPERMLQPQPKPR